MEIINRDNYETWLMLYLDNELTASERLAVEAFLGTQPDLQQEFNSLKEVMLQADIPESMPGKERLLMPQIWQEESLSRQQEQLLMLTDNTLPEAEKALLKKEIEQSPVLQKEWELLQKTRLIQSVPEEMPGKESLYRKGNTRVVAFSRKYRIAAAAAILAFGLFFAAKMLNNNTSGSLPAVATKEKAVIVPQTILEQKSIVESEMASNQPNLSVPVDEKVGDETAQSTVILKEADKSGESVSIAGNKEIKADKPTQMPSVMERQQKSDVIRDIAIVPQVKNIDIEGVDAVLPTSPIQPANSVAISIPEQAKSKPYEIFDLEDFDEDDTINIAGARISKQKVRGIYRNITRPIARSFDKNVQKVNETK